MLIRFVAFRIELAYKKYCCVAFLQLREMVVHDICLNLFQMEI